MWSRGVVQLVSSDEALDFLVAGNTRFRQGNTRSAGVRPEDLAELAKGQRPFATILGCSDSRVAPELIFDAVLGELFVIRVAGNVVSSEIAGSLQYAGQHLRTPLFVVLGHSGCGAVHAALSYRLRGVQHRSRIQILVDSILPGLDDIDPTSSAEEQLADAVEANVLWTMRQLLATEAGARVMAGEFRLVGGIYDMTTGCVRFL
jgi:carbonic anhydrase